MKVEQIELEYHWVSVINKDGSKYRFPDERGTIGTSYARPAIYRWAVSDPDGNNMYYIGEAMDLRRRIYGYLNPGPTQETNKWMNKELSRLVEEGFVVELEVIDGLRLFLGAGLSFSDKDLESKHFRRLIENLMLSISEKRGDTLLNK